MFSIPFFFKPTNKDSIKFFENHWQHEFHFDVNNCNIRIPRSSCYKRAKAQVGKKTALERDYIRYKEATLERDYIGKILHYKETTSERASTFNIQNAPLYQAVSLVVGLVAAAFGQAASQFIINLVLGQTNTQTVTLKYVQIHGVQFYDMKITRRASLNNQNYTACKFLI